MVGKHMGIHVWKTFIQVSMHIFARHFNCFFYDIIHYDDAINYSFIFCNIFIFSRPTDRFSAQWVKKIKKGKVSIYFYFYSDRTSKMAPGKTRETCFQLCLALWIIDLFLIVCCANNRVPILPFHMPISAPNCDLK